MGASCYHINLWNYRAPHVRRGLRVQRDHLRARSSAPSSSFVLLIGQKPLTFLVAGIGRARHRYRGMRYTIGRSRLVVGVVGEAVVVDRQLVAVGEQQRAGGLDLARVGMSKSALRSPSSATLNGSVSESPSSASAIAVNSVGNSSGD